jgi:pilus assembly protein CpaD
MTSFGIQQHFPPRQLRKNLLRTAAVAAVLLAGSCASPSDDHPVFADGLRNHPITVAPHYQAIRVAFSDPAAGLSPEDGINLSAFVDDYLARGDGQISITAPRGPNSSDALAYLGNELARMGVPRSRILVGTHDNANGDTRIEIGYIAYEARTDACGNWSQDAHDNFANTPMPDFGCSNQHNLAAMVSDPRDLTAPRGMGPSDATRRETVVGSYEKAQTTGQAKSSSQSASLSDVGSSGGGGQ